MRLYSRAPLPLIPPALFSHTGRRGSLGVLMAEAGDGTQGLAKTSAPVRGEAAGDAGRTRALPGVWRDGNAGCGGGRGQDVRAPRGEARRERGLRLGMRAGRRALRGVARRERALRSVRRGGV